MLRHGFEREGLFTLIGTEGESVGGCTRLEPTQGVVFIKVDLQMVFFIALDKPALFEKLGDAYDDFV